MQPAQNLRPLFLGRSAETGECVLSCGDGALRVLFIGQRDAADHSTVCRLDDVHDLCTMRFNERPVYVVLRDCVHTASPSFLLITLLLVWQVQVPAGAWPAFSWR